MSDKHPAERLFGCMWAVLNRRHVPEVAALAIKTAVETAAGELGFTMDEHDNLLDLMAQFRRDGTSKCHGDMTRLMPGLRKIRAVFIEHDLGDVHGHGKSNTSKKSPSSPAGTRGKNGYQHQSGGSQQKMNRERTTTPVQVQTVGKEPKTVEYDLPTDNARRSSPKTGEARRQDDLPQPTRLVKGRPVWEC